MRRSLFASLVVATTISACKPRIDHGSTVKDDSAPSGNQINGVPVPQNLTAVINCINALPFVPAPVAAAVQAAAGNDGQLPPDFISSPPNGLVDAISAADDGAGSAIAITNAVLQCAVNLPVATIANAIAPWYSAVQTRLDRRNTAPPVGSSAAVDRYSPDGACSNSGGYCCYNQDCTFIGTCHLSATGNSCTNDSNFYETMASTLNGTCNWQVTCHYKSSSACIFNCSTTKSYGVSAGKALHACSPSTLQNDADTGCQGIAPDGYGYSNADSWSISFVP